MAKEHLGYLLESTVVPHVHCENKVALKCAHFLKNNSE